jgi:hypothetical protein
LKPKIHDCSGPMYSYLGHFRKPENIRAGHNTVPTPDYTNQSGKILSNYGANYVTPAPFGNPDPTFSRPSGAPVGMSEPRQATAYAASNPGAASTPATALVPPAARPSSNPAYDADLARNQAWANQIKLLNAQNRNLPPSRTTGGGTNPYVPGPPRPLPVR